MRSLLCVAVLLLISLAGCAEQADEPGAAMPPEPEPTTQPTVAAPAEPATEPGAMVINPEVPQPGESFRVSFEGDHGRPCDPDWELRIHERFQGSGTQWQGESLILVMNGSWPVDAEATINREVAVTAILGLSCSPETTYRHDFTVEPETAQSQDCDDTDYDGVCDGIDVCPRDSSDKCALACESPDHGDSAGTASTFTQDIGGCIDQGQANGESECATGRAAYALWTISSAGPGCPANDDEDWFSIPAETVYRSGGATVVSYQITYDHDAGDLDLYAYVCGSRVASATGTTTIVTFSPGPDNQLVVVGRSSGASFTNTYTLQEVVTPDAAVPSIIAPVC